MTCCHHGPTITLAPHPLRLMIPKTGTSHVTFSGSVQALAAPCGFTSRQVHLNAYLGTPTPPSTDHTVAVRGTFELRIIVFCEACPIRVEWRCAARGTHNPHGASNAQIVAGSRSVFLCVEAVFSFRAS